MEAALVFNPSV